MDCKRTPYSSHHFIWKYLCDFATLLIKRCHLFLYFLESELCPETSFGQWGIKRCDISRSLKSLWACPLLLETIPRQRKVAQVSLLDERQSWGQYPKWHLVNCKIHMSPAPTHTKTNHPASHRTYELGYPKASSSSQVIPDQKNEPTRGPWETINSCYFKPLSCSAWGRGSSYPAKKVTQGSILGSFLFSFYIFLPGDFVHSHGL